MGSIRGMLVDTGNKNTAGSNDRPAVLLNRYSMQNCIGRCVHEIYISTFNVFEKSWLMVYYGVVTVTEADFGPRVLLTTAAIA